jgi:hypothetical protein
VAAPCHHHAEARPFTDGYRLNFEAMCSIVRLRALSRMPIVVPLCKTAVAIGASTPVVANRCNLVQNCLATPARYQNADAGPGQTHLSELN